MHSIPQGSALLAQAVEDIVYGRAGAEQGMFCAQQEDEVQ
jgi:hypothetical protein